MSKSITPKLSAFNRQSFVGFATIVQREVRRFCRIWVQTLVPPIITMALYFVIFGHLIGSRIGTIEGYPYMQYIVSGLVMMSVITNSYANVVTSFFSSKFQRNIEEMIVAPIPNIMILLGFVVGGMTRGLLTGIIVMVVALFFTHIQIHNVWITLSIVLLASMLFSIAGFVNAMYAKKFDDVSIVPTFVLTPLTYFGGVFYSIDMLPGFWQHASLINPILYIVNAFRFGILGISDINVGFAFGIIILFSAGFFIFAMRLLNKGVGIRS